MYTRRISDYIYICICMKVGFLWGYSPKLVFSTSTYGEFEYIVTCEDEVSLGYQLVFKLWKGEFEIIYNYMWSWCSSIVGNPLLIMIWLLTRNRNSKNHMWVTDDDVPLIYVIFLFLSIESQIRLSTWIYGCMSANL